MTDKIEEITKKIYNEGVIKAKKDTDQIIDDAKAKAEEIIHSAKKVQKEIIEQAKQQADELKQKTDTEIQLAARQFTSRLKQQITEIVTTSQVDNQIKQAFNDSGFIKEMILTIIKNWNPQKPDELDLRLLLPESKEKEIENFFDSKTNETLGKGVELKLDPKLESGFKIGPKDGSYVISFSDKDFENYFKRYFKDRTKRLLFASVDNE
ncbi:MAG: V-type ATP synthase subunit E [Bacteroidota bacterium]